MANILLSSKFVLSFPAVYLGSLANLEPTLASFGGNEEPEGISTSSSICCIALEYTAGDAGTTLRGICGSFLGGVLGMKMLSSIWCMTLEYTAGDAGTLGWIGAFGGDLRSILESISLSSSLSDSSYVLLSSSACSSGMSSSSSLLDSLCFWITFFFFLLPSVREKG